MGLLPLRPQRRHRLTALLVIGLLGTPTSTAAQTIVGVDSLNGDIYAMDPHSGATTVLGNLGPPFGLWTAMAKDSQGRFFVTLGTTPNPFSIYEVDIATWSSTFVVQTSLNGIRGLAFGPGDVLFAIHDTTVPFGGGPDDLYTIDLLTGSSTRIGATGFRILQSLAYGQGSLWSWDFQSEGLVQIDPLTGIASDVNPLVDDRDFGVCQTLCFSDNGVLYGGFSTLAVIDPVTGVPAHISKIDDGFGLVTGMEFLPNQPEPFALWVQGTAGGPMAVQVSGATPGATVAILVAYDGGGPISVPPGRPCAGLRVNLNATTRLLGLTTADAQGAALLGPALVPAAAREHAHLQAVDFAACATSNRAKIYL